MQKLIQGIHHFQTHTFHAKLKLFQKLANGQRPQVLFITCSDSRINPHLLLDAEPGDLFVLRNAGNLIPAAPESSGELATIEFALVQLGIQEIILCGHSDCGAMKGLISGAQLSSEMPAVSHWLRYARRTREIIETRYEHLQGQARVTATVEENVLVQIENLRSHAMVQERLEQGTLRLHGWVYKIETGEVFAYDPSTGQFLPLVTNKEPRPIYPSCAGQHILSDGAVGQ